MPYFAVGFGSWSDYGYRHATEEEKQEWKQKNPDKDEPEEWLVRNVHYHGCSAKTAGPFPTPKKAWKAASDLQKGASMGADFPFIFKYGKSLNLNTLANKLDANEYVIQDEYVGKHYIHKIVFTRDYQRELGFINSQGQKQEIFLIGERTPASRLARKKLINKERNKYEYGI